MTKKKTSDTVAEAKKSLPAAKRPKELKEIAQKAIRELERIAFSEEEPVKIRMDILKWFTEMDVGKPKSSSEVEEKGNKSFDINVYIEE